jgi:hypothetical protein
MVYFAVIASRATQQWSDHVDACKETWATTIRDGDTLRFLFGDATKELVEDNFLSLEGSVSGNDIQYPVADSYHKTLYKTLINMRDFLKTTHNFYVRTHTGSYLHLGIMHDMCCSLPSKNLYAGYHGFVHETNTHFASGACFVITRDVVERIVNEFPSHRSSLGDVCSYDDVALGSMVMKSFGVPLVELPRITIFDRLLFHPDIAHYYFTRESGKKPEYHRIIHEQFRLAGK